MNTPSVFQAAVYANIASGTGNTIVDAVAGSGKTTTIMGALASVPSGCTIALFAFNKSIATELGARAPRGVEVKTLHAHGFSAVRRAFPGVKVDNDKSIALCVALFGASDNLHPVRSRYSAVADLVSKAKDTLVARGDLFALDDLIDVFGIDCPDSDDDRALFVDAAMAVLVRSSEVTDVVDFSDMCWLPVVLNLRVWSYDRVFVDETQDLSPTQIELLLLCMKRNGRICAVGDERQAIYGFRGADVNTIPNLIKRLDATVLPLSITYRCARSIAALAATEVPHFTASDNAAEGYVGPSNTDAMIEAAVAGDMVISRANAPLMTLCLKFLASGRRASIKGRDVGAGIARLVKKSRARSVPAFLEWSKAWHKKETARLVKSERPTDAADDMLECLFALAEGAKGVPEILTRCDSLFSDEGGPETKITLGTTHKLKGLEADRVWMLEGTYRRNKGGEEANCWYVAVTRAKSSLYLVAKEAWKKTPGQ